MRKFSLDKPEEFKVYAVTDAVITLLHGLACEKFNYIFVDGRLTVPHTISSIARNFVLTK